jgi:hypothetical protein
MRHSINGVLLMIALISPAAFAAQSADPNIEAATGPSALGATGERNLLGFDAEALQRLLLGLDDEELADIPGLCGIAFVSGLARSQNIAVRIINLSQQQIEVAIVDPFKALGRRSLLIESVFNVVSPAGGTLDVLYPDGDPGGPAVVSFTGFDGREKAQFNLDPDTYDDLSFGATIANMNGTEIEVVYFGDLRCAGRFFFLPVLNVSFALLQQSSPTP